MLYVRVSTMCINTIGKLCAAAENIRLAGKTNEARGRAIYACRLPRTMVRPLGECPFLLSISRLAPGARTHSGHQWCGHLRAWTAHIDVQSKPSGVIYIELAVSAGG